MLDTVSILLDPALDSVRHYLPKDYAVWTTFGLALWRIERSYGIQRRVERLERERRTPMSYNLTWKGTPNFTQGRLLQKVDRIIIHWINGDLALADAAFSRSSRQASAHFGVEDGEVHQYVKLQDTSWGAGNWWANLHGVNIEHSAMPGRDLSDESYETSSQLIVDICRQLGLTPSRGLLHGHREYSATQCPGTIDLDRLARRAVELWNTPKVGIDQPIVTHAEQGTLASVSVPIRFQVEQTTRANWRNEPTTQSGIFATYDKGAQVWCTGTVQGQDPYNSGNATWYKSERSGKYIWSGAVKRI